MDRDFSGVVKATASGTASTRDSSAGQPALVPELLRLYHGTDHATALWIAEHGLSMDRMLSYCAKFGMTPNSFWTSVLQRVARDYSGLNYEVQMNSAEPAIVSFSLPVSVVMTLMERAPPLVVQWSREDADCCFYPEAFSLVNSAMADPTVTLTAEIRIED